MIAAKQSTIDIRRRDALERAVDYTLEHGLADLSLRPLAEAIGTSGRMLIYYFGSKDQLIVEILHEVRRRKTIDLALAEREDALRVYWRWASSPEGIRYLRLVYEIYGLSLREPERFAGFLAEESRDVLDLIGAGLAAEGHPPAAVSAISTYVFGALRGLELDLLTTGERARVQQAFDLFDADLQRRMRQLLSDRRRE